MFGGRLNTGESSRDRYDSFAQIALLVAPLSSALYVILFNYVIIGTCVCVCTFRGCGGQVRFWTALDKDVISIEDSLTAAEEE